MCFQKIFKVILFLVGSFFLLESCTEKESIETDEINDFVSPLSEILASEIFRDTDRKFCFELEFPIELIFSDNTTRTISSFEKLMSTIEVWYIQNPDKLKTEPTIKYPIGITLEDEILSELNDDEAFLELIENCLDAVHLDFFKMLSSHCYQINYPITIIEKDDSKNRFDSYEDVYESLLSTESRPINIEFPFSITIDGKPYVINSEVDLEKSMDDCVDFLVSNSENQNQIVCAFIDSELVRWIQYQGNYQFLDDCFNMNYPITIVSRERGNSNINNNEEFAEAIEEILSRIVYDGDLIDFIYPIDVYVVDKDQQVSLNTGDEFIQLFEHCR